MLTIADRALAHRAGQGAVDPFGDPAAQQEASDQIRRGQVVVAGDRDQRPAEVMGHGLHETRLTAPGRALEQDREPLLVRRGEHLLLVTDCDVVRTGPRRQPASAVAGHLPG